MKTSSCVQQGTRCLVAFGLLFCLLVSGLGASGPVQAQQAARIIWLHHSCGQNLINQGDVREGLTSLGYEFFDHGYNDEGLRLANGSYAGYSFDIPGDNTDPDGLAELFTQPLHEPPDNAFSHLMEYDVIAFKSCFPTSNIGSDEQLAEYQAYYRAIRDRIAQHPDKLFITVTQPPQVPGASDGKEAARARALANWLGSNDYLAGLPNLVTFDFFGYLAGGDNFLRPEYRMDDYDAHPNERANREIGPQFVRFVDQAIRSYGAGPAPVASAAPTAVPQPTPSPREVAPMPPTAGRLVDDFEAGDRGWEANYDDAGSSVACTMDSSLAHGGAAALRAEYNVTPGGWGDCMLSYEALQDWSRGAGLSLWVRSDGEGQRVGLMIFAGDPMAATPFEILFETTAQTAEEWTELVFLWSDLNRAEWADPGGLPQLDPAQVLGYGFGLGLNEGRPAGILWVDDIQLASGKPEAAVEPTLSTEPTPQQATLPVEQASAGVVPTASPAPAEEKGSGGICPLAAMLSLGAVAVVLARRRL